MRIFSFDEQIGQIASMQELNSCMKEADNFFVFIQSVEVLYDLILSIDDESSKKSAIFQNRGLAELIPNRDSNHLREITLFCNKVFISSVDSMLRYLFLHWNQ